MTSPQLSPLIRFVVNWKATQETKHMLESTALPCGTRRAQIKENRELSVGHLFELNCQDSSCFYLATVSLWVIPRIRSETTEATVTNWDTVTSQMVFFELLNPLGFKAPVEAEVFQIEIFTPNVSKIQHFQNASLCTSCLYEAGRGMETAHWQSLGTIFSCSSKICCTMIHRCGSSRWIWTTQILLFLPKQKQRPKGGRYSNRSQGKRSTK